MPASLTDNPILAAWREIVLKQPDRAAVLGPDGGTLRTFADIENEAAALAKNIPATQGIALVELGNHPSLPALLLALWRAGRTVALAEKGACVTLPGITLRVNVGPASEVVFSPTGESPLFPDADCLKLTSGTTGTPRGIRFSAAQLLADCTAICETMGITSSDLNYGVISWAHSYGFSNHVLPLLCRGVPVVATEDRLPRAILSGLAATGATVFPAVPVFFQKLASLDAPPLPKLRLCISAGAQLSTEVAASFLQQFGVKVHSFYGSSECGGICYDATDDVAPEGFVGQPMKNVRLIVEQGRLAVHSPAAGLGYWPQPDATLTDGCFMPEDLVEQTDNGITIKGRVSDFINIAGRKLNPAEIERVMREHPAVRDVVVFGVPSSLRGEEPTACIVGDAAVEEFTAFAASRLAPWQMPKHFWLVPSLPVNERGKLSRRDLAARWAARELL